MWTLKKKKNLKASEYAFSFCTAHFIVILKGLDNMRILKLTKILWLIIYPVVIPSSVDQRLEQRQISGVRVHVEEFGSISISGDLIHNHVVGGLENMQQKH